VKQHNENTVCLLKGRNFSFFQFFIRFRERL